MEFDNFIAATGLSAKKFTTITDINKAFLDGKTKDVMDKCDFSILIERKTEPIEVFSGRFCCSPSKGNIFYFNFYPQVFGIENETKNSGCVEIDKIVAIFYP